MFFYYLLNISESIIMCSNPKPFDWYQNYDGVKDIVTQFIKKESRILNVGCGNSSIFILFMK